MLEQFGPVARAVSDPNRVRVLKMLAGGELCVCQITAVLDLATATVSKHLSLLRGAGLVASRKDGRWVYYRLADRTGNGFVAPMLAMVAAIGDDDVLAADCARLAEIRKLPLDRLCAPAARPGAVRDPAQGVI